MKKTDSPFKGSTLSNLQPYANARTEFTGNAHLFLDANENPYGKWNRYPDPLQTELKERLAEIKQLNPEQLVIGNGSDELIDLAFRLFCEPNQDEALTFGPTYGMYQVAADINRVRLHQAPLNANFDLDFASVEPYLQNEKLRLIIICSPNNPTGNVLNPEVIESILLAFDGIVLIDEAYIDFADSPSWTKRLADFPNLIVCQTLSKAWGLAGLRIGLAAMVEEGVALFTKVKPPYNVSACNQHMALQALADTTAYVKQVEEIKAERERMRTALLDCSCVVNVYPSQANFLLIEVTDANSIYQACVDQGVVLRNRHRDFPNTLRITLSTPTENERVLTCLKTLSLPAC